jgi:hypothetical protein
MNMKNTLLVLALSSTLFGCGNSKTDNLKEMPYGWGSDVTFGEIFDNWNVCESSKWSEYVSDKGKPTVEFHCNYKNVSTYMPKLRQALKDNTIQKADWAIRDYEQEVDRYASVISISITAKWEDSYDADTKEIKPFDVFSISHTIKWANGKDITFQIGLPHLYLKEVADNEPLMVESAIRNPKKLFGIGNEARHLYATFKGYYPYRTLR